MVHTGVVLRCLRFPALLTFFAALSGCAPPELGDTDAALALADIVAGSGHSRLKERTPLPSRRSISYEIDGRHYTGDVYLSPEGVRAGIVLVPGVVPAGKDDGRLVALAYTLARLQFAVLTPDLAGLRSYQVRKSNIREVADTFRYLVSRPDWAPQGRAGVAGFSYGAGPVLLATLQPDVREQVRFVVTLGGYYDLQSIVTYFTTGYYRGKSGDQWIYQQPNPYIKWVFTLSNADLLEHAEDREVLGELARHMTNDVGDEPEVPLQHLKPDARALVALLTNEDPARVPTLIAQLPSRIRDELNGLNPAIQDLSRFRAQAILIHGRSDTMIPYTESVALARALPPERVQLFLTEGFAHVDIKPNKQDIPQLLAAMQALLVQRAVEP
jgi:pimeloyl-ACP methyl ester carboxylesterase